MSWKNEQAQEVLRALAVNPAADESDLQELGEGRLRELLGSLNPTVTHHSDLDSLLQGEGREIWRTLLIAACAFLILESFLMVWVGRQG